MARDVRRRMWRLHLTLDRCDQATAELAVVAVAGPNSVGRVGVVRSYVMATLHRLF